MVRKASGVSGAQVNVTWVTTERARRPHQTALIQHSRSLHCRSRVMYRRPACSCGVETRCLVWSDGHEQLGWAQLQLE